MAAGLSAAVSLGPQYSEEVNEVQKDSKSGVFAQRQHCENSSYISKISIRTLEGLLPQSSVSGLDWARRSKDSPRTAPPKRRCFQEL